MATRVALKPALMGEGKVVGARSTSQLSSPSQFSRYHPVTYKKMRRSKSPLFRALVTDLQQDEQREGPVLLRKNRWLRKYRRRKGKSNGNRR